MKIALSEIKENLHGINNGRDKDKTQINDLKHKEEKSIQSEQHEEKRIQKNKDRLRSRWDNFKRSNIHVIGVPEREEKARNWKSI